MDSKNTKEMSNFGINFKIKNISGLQELIKSLKPNLNWQNDLNNYYNNEFIFEHHRNNCKAISSLKNRVFADYEWDILEKEWDNIKDFFDVSNVDNDAKSYYTNVINHLFKLFEEEWKRKKEKEKLAISNVQDRKYPRPFAEINRIFAGANRSLLCPIVDDKALKDLMSKLKDAGYIEFDKQILNCSLEEGGWIVRSAIVCSLFKEIWSKIKEENDENNWETLPWQCYLFFSKKQLIKMLESNHNIILTGAPGTGKTYSAQQIAEFFAGKDHVKKIQFHPSYDYTDLVEGMRPCGNNSFSRVDGSFKRFCKCAILGLPTNVSDKDLKAKEKETAEPSNDPYVFIIDEINRGEVSKIFGEVFFCIEESHRGKDEAMDTQYQNLVPEGDLFYEGFYVPDNVYLIGTMNDIDRSVESMDFAFRRRFAFIEIEASSNMLDSMDIDESKVIENLKNQMDALNKKIIEPQYGLSTAYQIGGAYFLKFEKYFSSFNDEKSAYKALWENHLKGTLFEYFRVLPQEDRKKYMTDMERAFLGNFFEDKKKKTPKEEPTNAPNNDGQ